MKAFVEQEPISLGSEIAAGSGTLFDGSEAAPLEERLLETLERMPAGGLLPVDFEGVRVSSEAAQQLLRRAFRRITSGELPDRYIVILNVGRSRYNLQVMLEAEEMTLVERTNDGTSVRLFGKIEPAMKETHAFLLSRPTATAKDVFEEFKLNTISAATNRLTNLAKGALARRVEEQAVAGGGRQFVYAAVR
jgi:hypothetical protein